MSPIFPLMQEVYNNLLVNCVLTSGRPPLVSMQKGIQIITSKLIALLHRRSLTNLREQLQGIVYAAPGFNLKKSVPAPMWRFRREQALRKQCRRRNA